MKDDCLAAVIGLGLIGASFAAALRVARPRWSVIGFDQDEAVSSRALSDGNVHRVASTAHEAVLDADVIVLAAPVRVIHDFIRQLPQLTTGESIVLDVGSTKRTIANAMSALPERLQAIGGHPMTGALTAGSARPSARLFEGQRFVLTPTARTTPETRDWAQRLLTDFKADILVMDASRHDQAVAITSHLPHVLSLPLLELFAEQDDATRSLAAGGFRSRIEGTATNPRMWRDILLSNRDEILKALESYEKHLKAFQRDLQENSEERLLQRLEQASAVARHVTKRD